MTCPYTGTIFYNIRIYSRSQVSVYSTIGPLVVVVLMFSNFAVHILYTDWPVSYLERDIRLNKKGNY